ncbi:hypothetical protein NE237_023718 [Protea cynaroides]|uniref:Uncharacterized protein n=1 Tax=Protea cynaroides TaxID=273540 RepID=A0A9Q0HDD2_9MAGN|nr:hypothetical protein NE237_023718 [Protea cynaroides]
MEPRIMAVRKDAGLKVTVSLTVEVECLLQALSHVRFVGGASGQIIGRWGSENALQHVVEKMGLNPEGDGSEQVTEAEVFTDIGSAMSAVELLSGSWCKTGQQNGSDRDVVEVPKGGFNGAQGLRRWHQVFKGASMAVNLMVLTEVEHLQHAISHVVEDLRCRVTIGSGFSCDTRLETQMEDLAQEELQGSL